MEIQANRSNPFIQKHNTLLVTEIFHSLQGESSYAGLPCVFIRLTGCNLRCHYCDTQYSFYGGQKLTFKDLVLKIACYKTRLVEITGGEPLLQKGTPHFCELLLHKHYTVLVETSGAEDISVLDPEIIKIMDLKCPSSGECHRNRFENFRYLTSKDEVKFVIGSRQDYEWAKSMISEKMGHLEVKILFSAVFNQLNDEILADWILDDQLSVRMQIQLHKRIWSPNRRGV